MSEKVYDQVKREFVQAGASMRCSKVASLLTKLGFTVRNGKSGNHRVFVHKGISSFLSSSYDCGHGANPEVKPRYLSNILKILSQYEEEIRSYLKRGMKNG